MKAISIIFALVLAASIISAADLTISYTLLAPDTYRVATSAGDVACGASSSLDWVYQNAKLVLVQSSSSTLGGSFDLTTGSYTFDRVLFDPVGKTNNGDSLNGIYSPPADKNLWKPRVFWRVPGRDCYNWNFVAYNTGPGVGVNVDGLQTTLALYSLGTFNPGVASNYSLELAQFPSNGGNVYGAGSNLTYGTYRTIGAVASAGYRFVHWASGTALCPITNENSSNTTIRITPLYGTRCEAGAIFNATNYSLVVLTDLDKGTSYGSASNLAYGSVRAIYSVAYPNFKPVGWDVLDLGCAIANQSASNTTVTITPASGTVCRFSAAFEGKPICSISASAVPAVAGRVTSTYWSNITCGTTMNYLEAMPNPGYAFVNWSSNCRISLLNANGTKIAISLYPPTGTVCTATAYFSLTVTNNYSLYVGSLPVNGGVVTGTSSGLSPGAVRSISATPNTGYAFGNWSVNSGNCAIANPGQASTYVTMGTGDCYVMANFRQIGQTLPDYMASGGGLSQYQLNQTYSYTVGTYNIGNGATTASTTKLYVEGRAQTFGVPALATNGSWEATATIYCTAPGQFNITIVSDAGSNIAESNENNNILSKTATCTEIPVLPDLVISGVGGALSATAGATTTISATTKNQGAGNAAATTTTLFRNGGMVSSLQVPVLASLQSATQSFQVACPAAGAYNITVVANYPHAIAETDEANNYRYAILTCAPAQPVCNNTVPTCPAGSNLITYTDSVGCPAYACSKVIVPIDSIDIVSSIADASGDMYAKLMNILGIYVEGAK